MNDSTETFRINVEFRAGSASIALIFTKPHERSVALVAWHQITCVVVDSFFGRLNELTPIAAPQPFPCTITIGSAFPTSRAELQIQVSFKEGCCPPSLDEEARTMFERAMITINTMLTTTENKVLTGVN